MSNPAMLLPPGFRFHPTDEELILHYLTKRTASMPCPVSIIAAVDIYKFDPWDLPAKAMFGDREWYFFSPRDRKYPNGARPNRAAASGYWKATGTDKPIVTSKGDENIGLKKSLVFYVGKPPKGVKTDWIMHEYRLAAEAHNNKNYKYKPLKLTDSSSMRLDDWVLCRIYKRSNHQTSVDTEKDSAVEDVFIPIPPSTTQHNSTFNLPKSCSLSELLNAADFAELSRLLEHPSDTPDLENNSIGCPMLHQEFNGDIRYSNDNGCLVQHPSRAESPAWMTENSVKREWTANGCFQDGSEVLPTAKRSRIASNLANKFNFISQPFFNQQLISNSRLG